MKQVATSGLPPVIYALLAHTNTQVVVFKTEGIPDNLGKVPGLREGSWSHWGVVRSEHDEPGENVYLLVLLDGEVLRSITFLRLSPAGKYLGGGYGSHGDIWDWATDLRGVAYRWRRCFEVAIARRGRLGMRAKKDEVFLEESLALFSEFPYSAGLGE